MNCTVQYLDFRLDVNKNVPDGSVLPGSDLSYEQKRQQATGNSRKRLSTIPRTGVRRDLDGGHHLSSRRLEGDPLQSLPLEGRTIRRMHDDGPRELHVGHSEAPRRIPERSAGRASQLWHERPQFHLLTRTGGGASLDDRGGGALRHREALL